MMSAINPGILPARAADVAGLTTCGVEDADVPRRLLLP
jgi:hypothetical protein